MCSFFFLFFLSKKCALFPTVITLTLRGDDDPRQFTIRTTGHVLDQSSGPRPAISALVVGIIFLFAIFLQLRAPRHRRRPRAGGNGGIF